MFVLAKEMSWVWPVDVRYPKDGQHVAGQFRARFRVLSAEQIDAANATPDPVAVMMRGAVVELLDLQNEAGTALTHSPELLEAVLALPFMKIGLSTAYVASLSAAPAKNSETPAAAG